MRCFNPRARDGREQVQNLPFKSESSFNPRARDGREVLDPSASNHCGVSIHAPVMDAKTKRLRAAGVTVVSIHAPVMDAKEKQCDR